MSTRRRVYPRKTTFKGDVRLLPFDVWTTPETRLNIRVLRQVSSDPVRTWSAMRGMSPVSICGGNFSDHYPSRSSALEASWRCALTMAYMTQYRQSSTKARAAKQFGDIHVDVLKPSPARGREACSTARIARAEACPLTGPSWRASLDRRSRLWQGRSAPGRQPGHRASLDQRPRRWQRYIPCRRGSVAGREHRIPPFVADAIATFGPGEDE